MAIVLFYTVFGGMFSVAWTDFMQMTLIVIGLLYIAWLVGAFVPLIAGLYWRRSISTGALLSIIFAPTRRISDCLELNLRN